MNTSTIATLSQWLIADQERAGVRSQDGKQGCDFPLAGVRTLA
jgi:hypothetical protein